MTTSGSTPACRVCLLIGAFHPVVGGGETHARLLARELIRLGIPIFVLTRRFPAGLPATETVEGVPVTRLRAPGSARWGKYGLLAPAYRELVRRAADYDIVYVCGLRVLGLAGVAAARRLGKRCILRAESCGEYSGGFMWDSPDGRPRRSPRRALERMVAARNRYFGGADRFLAISGAIRREFLDGGVPAARIADIPNGVDTEHFRPPAPGERALARERLGLPAGARVLAYSGKLNRGKGLEALLRVWRDLGADRADARLLLIGGGALHSISCETELRNFVSAHGLEESVRFTGYVSNVREHLWAADAYVFPSEQEAMPLAPLEAMACGMPVLCTRVGDLDRVVEPGRNGWLIAPRDEPALHEGVRRLLLDPAGDARLGAAGRDTVARRFSIVRVAERHAELFRKLAGGVPGRTVTDAPAEEAPA